MSRVHDDDKPSPSMADEPQQGDLAGSSATFPTDSENYASSHNDLSPSPPSSSTSPMILYSPPTIWGLLRGAAINLLLPFVNGLMLGLGELLAHEAAFRLGWSGTKFTSSRSTHVSSRLQVARPRSITPGARSVAALWPLMRFGRNGGSRFASTTSTDTPFADIQSELPTPSESPIPSDEPFLSTSLDNITSTVPPPVYEHLGFLKELGLDYGWGFTASVEWLLEHVHVYAGTPWWASLGLTMLLIRACLLKTYIGAADSSARGQFIAPLTEPLMARMKEAQAQRDMAGSQKALRELKDLRARAGVKTWKIFLPFIQVPIGFGTFRLVRGMSTLPVPGLDTGGLLWMKDLTLSDPYFILPMLTAASYYVAFKIGGESGGNSMMTPTVQNIFLYVLPPLGGLFMCYWPGALQFTLLVQAIISLVQSTAFKQPWFREMLGIHPLPGPGDLKPNTNTYSGTINKSITLDPAAEAKKKGIFGGAQADIRSAYSAMKDKAKDYQQKSGDVGKRSMIEIEHARKYDERRRREIAQLKFEQEQRRLEDEERKQRLLGKSRR